MQLKTSQGVRNNVKAIHGTSGLKCAPLNGHEVLLCFKVSSDRFAIISLKVREARFVCEREWGRILFSFFALTV